MVGIDVGRQFQELHEVDQFALCGVRPEVRLTFLELQKQAIRVAVLLHDDFKKPQGVVPPFSSAVANGLKGCLQAQVSDKAKSRAVRLFYANTAGHQGLIWQPFLKGTDGNLLPRTDPTIWQRPETGPHKPETEASRKRGRSDFEQDEELIPERKRRAWHSTPGSREEPHQQHSKAREDEPAVKERQRSTYASTPGTREEIHRSERAATPPTSPTPSDRSSSNIHPGDPARYRIEQLLQLAELAGDTTGHRVAVACLPDHQGRVVTIGFDDTRRLIYTAENIDFRGGLVVSPNTWPRKMTFRRLLRERHVLFGRFIGATYEELYGFALALYLGMIPPLAGRSPDAEPHWG